MRCALIIASIFPPGTTSAGIRSAKLARAAAQAGLPVRFVHADDKARRYAWLDGVQGVSFRAPVATQVFRRQRVAAEGAGQRASWPGFRALRTTGRRALRALLQPDEYILDAAPFARAIVDEVAAARSGGAQPIVIACCPPWSTSLPARWAARHARAPLVLDLQDLWSLNPVARWTWFSALLARRIERAVVCEAAGFVFINERIAARYLAAHPGAARRPAVVAHIGVEKLPTEPMIVVPREPFRLLHIGSIYADRDISGLLDACVDLRRAGHDVSLTWHGAILGAHPLRDRLEEYRQAGALQLHGLVPHEIGRARMREADMLVAVPSPAYHEELTGKLFDYIDAARPILAIAPPTSYIAELVVGSGLGNALRPDDRGGLRSLLGALMTSGAVYHPDPTRLRDLTLDTIGARLLELAREVCP